MSVIIENENREYPYRNYGYERDRGFSIGGTMCDDTPFDLNRSWANNLFIYYRNENGVEAVTDFLKKLNPNNSFSWLDKELYDIIGYFSDNGKAFAYLYYKFYKIDEINKVDKYYESAEHCVIVTDEEFFYLFREILDYWVLNKSGQKLEEIDNRLEHSY